MSGARPARQDRTEVDARFLLANERTLLAWIRTGLAVQAGGLALLGLFDGLAGRRLLAISLLVLGLGCHLAGWWRHRRADRALRAGGLPAFGVATDAIVIGIVVVTGAVVATALRP